MIDKENYVVFCEDGISIMFDKISGTFCDVSSACKSKYDEIYSQSFAASNELIDTFACEGTRLGRLSLLATQCCNLTCSYCFANDGTYNATSNNIMSAETMKKAFVFFCEKYKDGINLVHFFGGEPMLGYENIKEFVPWCYEYCREKNIVPPVFSIVSNGTIMNKEIFQFFNKYKVNIVVSIDGNKQLNDLTRYSPSIDSVYDVIKSNFSGIPKERDFKIGCEMTINKNHIKAYRKGIVKDWLDDICEIGFNYATVGVVETTEDDCRIDEAEKEILQDIERESIDYFFHRLIYQEDFKSVEIVSLIRQMASRKRALSCGAGYHSLTVDPNGKIMPCYQFYHDDKFDMGNIEEEDELRFNEVKTIFKDPQYSKATSCEKCWLNGQCTVLCKGFSYNRYGVLNQISESRCWMISAAARRIMMHLVKLKKSAENYELFVKRLYEFNRSYTYNK
ncbi:MAG: SPASM domain-containing protein [Clostridiales bacterium]|nr:SPASM domain-containing protein [Clostridiales bacterium]NLL72561.1 SPASM domain-containing protein [Clostridiales bacterium]